MNCETFTTKIGESDYSYTQLPASKSLVLKFTIAGIFGSSISNVMPFIGKSDELQIEAFGKAVSEVFSKNDPDKILALIVKIFEPAFKNGSRINVDEDFTGDMKEMYSVLMWILKKEYGSFFEGMQRMF